MKKLFTIFTFSLLALTLILASTKTVVNASSSTTENITDNNGNVVYYRGSSEPIKKMKNFNYPTQQLRAAWVSNFVGSMPNYTTPEAWKRDFNHVLDNMQEVGLNTIIYHIRSHNNAVYPSKYNPKAKYVAGINFDEFDPLTYMVEETHRRGMEFHAWLNPYRVDDSYLAPGEKYPSTNPASNSKNLLVNSDGKKILNPGLPEVRKFIVDTCMEVVENYDVDAIHFDDYFYINGIKDDSTRAKYNPHGLGVDDWRREQVNLFIEDLSNNIREFNKKNNKAVQLGIAPTGIYRNGRYHSAPTYDSKGNLTITGSATGGQEHYAGYLYADTLHWINEEWIDYIMPQTYWSIEKDIASFGALTRWWSWAVRNKNVNLYCGMGIYMAENNSGNWGKNDNEIQDQMLNMAMYPEIGGMSLYSYNYINSSNRIIKKGMDLYKNDYFNKFVPADVKKSYSNLPSYAPTSVIKSGNEISWTPVDGARGYMVYEVPRGMKPDKNNIDHIYKYTTATSIGMSNPSKDYYVATVNQANVISKPKEPTEETITAKYVDSLISKLPSNITLEDEATVNNIVKLFESLSTSEKQKVTLIDTLNAAVEKIDALNAVKEETKEFLETVDTHIVTDRVLPTKPGFEWSYVNSSDANIYNIKTGERIKNYLDKKIIELNLTHTLNGLTYTEKVKINVGLTAIDEVPLFYRNDASSMNEDDEGAFKPGDGKFIGWSNVVLKFDKNVLYVAKNNYQAVSSVDEIKESPWVSCASVVKNTSSGAMKFSLSRVYPSKSSNDDTYFIIRNNKITNVTKNTDYSVSVTLEKGDTLVILRYLDSLNFGNIIFPFEQFDGKSISIIDYNNPDELANEVINAINTLPTEITLADEELVMSILNKYNSLPEEAKGLVTNYPTLEKAVNTIKDLKKEQEMVDSLKKSLTEFFKGINVESYAYKDREAIKNIVEDALREIKAATSTSELNSLEKAYKEKLAQYKTYEEDINLKKQDVISDLTTYVDFDKYSEAGKETINSIIASTKVEIMNASTIKDIDNIFNKYKQKIDSVDTLADELDKYKSEMSIKVRQYVILSAYSQENQDKLNDLIAKTQDKIAAAKSVKDVDAIYEAFTKEVDKVETLEKALVRIKATLKEKINELKASYDFSKYLPNDAKRMNTLFNDYYADVDNITTAKEGSDLYDGLVGDLSEYKTIDVLFEEALNKITTNLNEYLINVIKKTTPSLADPTNELTEELNSYLASVKAMEKETVISDANKIITEGRSKLDKKSTDIIALATAVANAITTINSKDKTIEGVDALVKEYEEKLNAAKSVSEVDNLLAEFNTKYTDLTDTGCAGCGSNSAMIVLSIISACTLLAIAFKRH